MDITRELALSHRRRGRRRRHARALRRRRGFVIESTKDKVVVQLRGDRIRDPK